MSNSENPEISKPVRKAGKRGDKPRVPVAVLNPMGGAPLQVNFCRSPICSNYGVPAHVAAIKTGPSLDRDDCYVVQNTGGGGHPALRCKACNEKPIIKSNQGIAEEIARLTAYFRSGKGCPETYCSAHNLDVSDFPFLYSKRGGTRAGTTRYECKLCGKVFAIGKKRKFGGKGETVGVFMDIVNRSPMRRTLERLGWRRNDCSRYYPRFEHISEKCLEFSASFDRRLFRGDVPLGELYLSTDGQQYSINWDTSKDRQYTLVTAICTADNASGFIFGMHAAYDPDIDPAQADREMIESGEHGIPEAYRRHARLWMLGDEYERNRSGRARQKITSKEEMLRRIEQEYADSVQRADCEDAEKTSKSPRYGKLVHVSYTAYAAMFILERLTCGADRVIHCLDHESMLRAACLTAFESRIRKKTAHAFYVSVNKNYTVPERKSIRAAALQKFRAAHKALLAKNVQLSDVIAMEMKRNIAQAEKIGPWHDQWAKHPLPRMDEPEKAMCWLTRRGQSVNADIVQMHLDASMHAVDNTFQLVRRRIHMLDRTLLTASSQWRGWNGYAFYNPGNVQKALNILRCYLNFCVKSRADESTPAMRLGLTDRAYSVEEILNYEPKHAPLAESQLVKAFGAACQAVKQAA